MRLVDGISRTGVVRLTGVLVATVAVAACCVGVSSAATEGVIRTIPVGGNPYAVSSDGTDVWVKNFIGGVSEIEASSGTVIRTITVGGGQQGTGPGGVYSDGTHVWVANEGGDTVSEIEASSGTVIRTITVGSGPWGVSSDGTHVWVTNQGEATVSEIEASSGTVIQTIPVGSPGGVSSDGTHVWVTNFYEDTVSEIPTSYTPKAVLGAQQITFTSTAPASATVGGVSYTVAATGGASGNPVTFSSGAPTVCSISGATVSFTGAGTCTIDANQAGNADYLSAPQVSQSFTVTPKPKATPKAISAVAAFSLPSAKQCVSRRRFTIHVRKLPGITWVSAVIKINHKRIKTLGRVHITALVNLVRLPKGTFVLSITAKASNGQSVTGTRTYHTCVPKSKSHYPTPKL